MHTQKKRESNHSGAQSIPHPGCDMMPPMDNQWLKVKQTTSKSTKHEHELLNRGESAVLHFGVAAPALVSLAFTVLSVASLLHQSHCAGRGSWGGGSRLSLPVGFGPLGSLLGRVSLPTFLCWLRFLPLQGELRDVRVLGVLVLGRPLDGREGRGGWVLHWCQGPARFTGELCQVGIHHFTVLRLLRAEQDDATQLQ